MQSTHLDTFCSETCSSSPVFAAGLRDPNVPQQKTSLQPREPLRLLSIEHIPAPIDDFVPEGSEYARQYDQLKASQLLDLCDNAKEINLEAPENIDALWNSKLEGRLSAGF